MHEGWRETMHAEPAPAPLEVLNLFSALRELATLVVVALDRELWLDAFLLAAGMSQLVEDHLEPDPLSLRRTGSFLANSGARSGRYAGAASAVLADGLARSRRALPGETRAVRLADALAAGLDELARVVLGGPSPDDGAAERIGELARTCRLVRDGELRLPASLLEDVPRLPACFRSFDQHPADMRALAAKFARADDDRERPLAVVGVRTSGSFLAPLLAASLREEGYMDVRSLTLRPGRQMRGPHPQQLAELARSGGCVLLCDDPPGTGSSLVKATGDLLRAHVGSDQIVLALALFGDADELPAALAGHRAVLLCHDEWSIHERIGPAAVREAVDAMLGAERRAVGAECLELRSPNGGRGHLAATYEITVEDPRTRHTEPMLLSVESVGIGYFGAHAASVAEPLREFLPPVLGVHDGLLMREWMPSEGRADRLPGDARALVVESAAAYVSARHRHLALSRDVTLRQSGQYPAWEAASTVLSRTFGRAWPLGRRLVTDRAAKRLLRVAQPSVVDGRVTPSRWFLDGDAGRMVKVDWDQGASWNLGLTCCDPVFDLASMALDADDAELGDALRRAYGRLEGEQPDAERWLLYELAHLSAPGAPPAARPALQRARARAVQRYFAVAYFEGLSLSDDGPLAGIDLDGVLETEHLGFPSLTPASAAGLRALVAHGYRPVLVTGRSLLDVQDRCRHYPLAGAVAEYGCVTFVPAVGATHVLVDEAERAALEALRRVLRDTRGVTLDDDYRHAIRAFVRSSAGARRPLPDELLRAARQSAGTGALSLVNGDEQTDIVPASIDKGRGARSLIGALSGEDAAAGPTPLAFAVGDTATDRPLLALARRPFAPGHARGALAAAGTITRGTFQRGFAEAVGELIGHRAGGCAQCRPPEPPRGRRLLLGVLGIREAGTARLPLQIVRLAALGAI
jgi:hydroxymethylpyrimidine pyrophosphatase-like HAD family hydrolase